MSFYSFIQAQLPTLSLDGRLPLTPLALAKDLQSWLPSAQAQLLIRLAEGEWPDHPIINDFLRFDTQLRNQLVSLRAPQLNRDPNESTRGRERLTPYYRQQVVEIAKGENPEEAEKQLDQLRWHYIEQCVALEIFNFSFLIGYMLRLKLATRWAELDEEQGRQMLQDALVESVREAIGTSQSTK